MITLDSTNTTVAGQTPGVCCFGYSLLTHLPASNRFHGTFYCGTEPQSQLPLRHASELEQVLFHYRVHRSERGAPRTGCQFCRLCEFSSVCFVRLPSFAARGRTAALFLIQGCQLLPALQGYIYFPTAQELHSGASGVAVVQSSPSSSVLDIPSPAVSARGVQ